MTPEIITMIREGGILYILLMVALTMHEFGHAYVADKLGDPLPRMDGRVTLNPIAHMDMLGSVILPIFMIFLSMQTNFPLVFGWGKPVRIALHNPKTRKKVDILSTLGGVGMNLVVAFVFALVLAVFIRFNFSDYANVMVQGIIINCVLFFFNMLPIPPLDGSRLMKYAVNMSEEMFASISKWSIVIIIILINLPMFKIFLQTVVSIMANFFFLISELLLKVIS